MFPRIGETALCVARIGLAASTLFTTCAAWAEPQRVDARRAQPPRTETEKPDKRKTDVGKAEAGKADAGKPQTQEADPAKPAASAAPIPPDVEKYCANIGGPATTASFAYREQELRDLEKKIEQRISELDAKRVEVQRMIDANEATINKADQGLVELYSKMKPDTAANQIAKLDDDIAVALLLKVKTKELSAIMDEMETDRAAALAKKLSQKMHGVKDAPKDGKQH